MKHISLGFYFALAVVSVPFLSNGQCTTATNISTVAGNHTKGYSGDGGAANAAQMGSPYAVTTDPSGNVYIADYFNNAVRKVSTSGIITTVAGTGTAGYSGDGGPATNALLNGPAGVTTDAAGNLYIADKFNERIRKVAAGTGVITSIAGNGQHGGWAGAAFGNGGPATAAALTYPVALAIDCSGNMYIADKGSQTVRKINTSGIITRFAGTHAGGYNGDGIAATAAKLNTPTSIATDCSGNVYISDTWNNRIRKVDASGVITTYAGTGTHGYTGDGGSATAATLFGPWGITLDGCGNMYVCDYDNYVVRKISASGVISTIAGNHVRGYTGDGAAATSAAIYLPSSLAIDGSNNLFIADYGNLVIRLMGTTGFASRAFNGGTTQNLHVCKGERAVSLDKMMTVPDAVGGETETWTVSADPEHGALQGFNATVVSNGGLVAPGGLTYTPEADFTGQDEFTIMMSDGTTTASTTITVVVDPLPNAGVITGTSVGWGSTVSLSNATGDAGGVWSSSDETIATVDATGKVTALTNGIVTIAYEVSNICGSNKATAIIHAEVSEIPAGKAIAFPNPNTGNFRLDFMSEVAQEMTLVATDITGRVVYTEKVPAVAGINTLKISLPDSVQRPTILRLSLANEKARKYEVLTVQITE